MTIEGLLDGCRRPDGVGRSGEGGHEPVTETLDQPAGMALDRPGHQPVMCVTEVLGGLLAEGATVTGFARTGCYVVERP